MFNDEEKLIKFKSIHLVEEAYKLLAKEEHRLKKEENRRVSKMKILNNLIIINLKK